MYYTTPNVGCWWLTELCTGIQISEFINFIIIFTFIFVHNGYAPLPPSLGSHMGKRNEEIVPRRLEICLLMEDNSPPFTHIIACHCQGRLITLFCDIHIEESLANQLLKQIASMWSVLYGISYFLSNIWNILPRWESETLKHKGFPKTVFDIGERIKRT